MSWCIKLRGSHLQVCSSFESVHCSNYNHSASSSTAGPSTPSAQQQGNLLSANSRWASNSNSNVLQPNLNNDNNDSTLNVHFEAFKAICSHLSMGPENPKLFVFQYNLCLEHNGYPPVNIPDNVIQSALEASRNRVSIQSQIPAPNPQPPLHICPPPHRMPSLSDFQPSPIPPPLAFTSYPDTLTTSPSRPGSLASSPSDLNVLTSSPSSQQSQQPLLPNTPSSHQ